MDKRKAGGEVDTLAPAKKVVTDKPEQPYGDRNLAAFSGRRKRRPWPPLPIFHAVAA